MTLFGKHITKLFQLDAHKTTIRTEIVAGVTTFMTMAYILAVNPAILGDAGMPRGGVFIATALSSVAATLIMALAANYPFALAPGMGLNAFFAYTVVLHMGYSWQLALLAVFIESLLFIAISLSPLRESILDAIPKSLKTGLTCGIGLLLAFIAMQNAGIIVANPVTFVAAQHFTKVSFATVGIGVVLSFFGIIITAVLLHRNVRGAIILGILIVWALGMVCQATGVYVPAPDADHFSLYPHLSLEPLKGAFAEFGAIFGQLFNVETWTLHDSEKTGAMLLCSLNFAVVVLSFLFVDFFDTLGSLVGLASKSNLLDENGKLPNVRGAFLADSVGGAAGAIFGTSMPTTYIESAAGIAVGGRTGLTSLTTALFFIVAIIFAPVFLVIPKFATASALLIVAFYMVESVKHLDTDDLTESLPAILAACAMPFTYSISEGISLGVISWTLLKLFTGQHRKISPFMYIIALLFVLRYIFI